MSKWILLKNGQRVASSDNVMELINIIDKDISTDEASYEITEEVSE